jgi:hypothetical protein
MNKFITKNYYIPKFMYGIVRDAADELNKRK